MEGLSLVGLPLVSVEPPDNTMFPNSDLRRSRSVRLMASTTIWWIPGYSRPMISGSKRISGARKRSEPSYIPKHNISPIIKLFNPPDLAS